MANLLINEENQRYWKRKKNFRTNEWTILSRHDSILAFSVCEIVKGFFTRKQKKHTDDDEDKQLAIRWCYYVGYCHWFWQFDLKFKFLVIEGEETPSLPRKVSIFCVRAFLIRCLLEFRDIIVADKAPQLMLLMITMENLGWCMKKQISLKTPNSANF